MSKQALKIISDTMNTLGIEYGFGEYSGDPVRYPYFVGEYTELEMFDESGLKETNFLLTGFSRGSWLELENAKERIEKQFNRVSGKIGITEIGSAIVITYSHALIVPTGDAELKSIQINLNIKEWMVI